MGPREGWRVRMSEKLEGLDSPLDKCKRLSEDIFGGQGAEEGQS